MISAELNSIFQKALTYAKDQRHEYLTIEHVFFALLGSKEGIAIIKENFISLCVQIIIKLFSFRNHSFIFHV